MDVHYFKNLLNSRNLRATHTRINLLMIIQNHGSAMQYSAIQKAMHPIDRVTLYRTLETLKTEGIIHKAFQENNETYYAICGSTCKKDNHHHEHIHFKCLECDTVSCEKPLNNLGITMPNYEIHTVSIHVKGICKNCKATAA